MSAGCLFTNGKLVLAGYHPKKGYITGIGGKRNPNEDPKDAAFRELMEELFCVDIEFKDHVCFPPQKVIISDDYINFHYTLTDLSAMLLVLSSKDIVSPLYNIFPNTIEKLLLNRRITYSSEIAHLVLLPVLPEILIANHFLRDLATA